jgi:RecJ-like exonuclease
MGLLDRDIINELNDALDEGEYVIKFQDSHLIMSDIFWTKRDLINHLKYSVDKEERFLIYKLDNPVFDSGV